MHQGNVLSCTQGCNDRSASVWTAHLSDSTLVCVCVRAAGADQVAKWACTPHCTPSPKQHSDKSQSQHFYTLINGHKEQKNDGRGPAQRCAETPALSPLLCWRMARSRSSCCWLHRTFETTPFTRNKVWSCECAGCRGWGVVCVGGVGVWYCLYTKRKAHFARSTWSWLPIHPADQQQGWVRAWKWGRKPLKLTWVTSVIAQRSPRGAPYGRSHIICSGITQRNPAGANGGAGLHTLFYPVTMQLRFLIGCVCWHKTSVSISLKDKRKL